MSQILQLINNISNSLMISRLPIVSDFLLKSRIDQQIQGNLDFMPSQLAIETVNYCNAKCIMCPSQKMKRQKGIMDTEVHRKIIDNVADTDSPISSISHAGLGEPLLDKKLADKIRYEKEIFKKAKVMVYTNAGLLDKERSSQIISSGLDILNISLNAFRKETYETVTKLPSERTLQNIEQFLRQNRENGSPIWVQVSLVPTTKCSPSEVMEFNDYWSEKVNSVVVPPRINWGTFDSSITKKQWPCRYIWDVLMIDWDGNVKMCCEDYDTEFPLGNIKVQSPLEIFNSKRMKNQRQAQLKNQFKWPRICYNCIETHEVARDFWKYADLGKNKVARK
jgi:radical SAM protein with 4Fe4S-binding SPASM domain